MKRRYLGLIILIAWTALWGQQPSQDKREPQGKGQPKEEPQPEPSPRRPTLGPQPEPSLYGPRTTTTNDPRKLMRVQKIFVEPIDNLLSEKLMGGLAKKGRFRIVAERREADAVLRGTCFDSRRLKVVHSEVYLNDRTTGAAIWQDSVRHPYNPPPLAAAVEDTAVRILTHLEESIQQAQHK